MTTWYIPDERGNKMEIPNDLIPEFRRLIRKYHDHTSSGQIRYYHTTQKDIDEFFENLAHNNFSSKDKRNK